jgi:hypothetical protein
MQMVEQEASGHNFTVCGKCKWWSKKRQGTTLQFAENANGGARSVRARLESCRKRRNMNWALAPGGNFSTTNTLVQRFSAR